MGPVLIDAQKYQQSILEFVVLVIHMLHDTVGLGLLC